MTYNIVQDSREQQPWRFKNVSIYKLDTGDYSIEGLEDILCIERKGSVSEFAGNVTRKNFWDTIERMVEMKHAYIIFDFSKEEMMRYPVGSQVPKKFWRRIRVRGKHMEQQVEKIEDMGIPIIFAGSRENAKQIALSLMDYVFSEVKSEYK